ncbi:MAG: hypothetical protein M1834_009371 [Cirrosporium novae-zelandiae]|nr:MAG: hypothetical protein M1834_009371 [Cirrosporium novae-zelandiae]
MPPRLFRIPTTTSFHHVPFSFTPFRLTHTKPQTVWLLDIIFPPGFRQTVSYAVRFSFALMLLYETGFGIHATVGPSMLPTISVSGDWVIVSRLHAKGKGVQRGDLVSAWTPMRHSDGPALKRVIGLPGDFVCKDRPAAGDVGSDGLMIQVPEGHCWIAGDNLPYSRDSRHYGPVPLALIRGKVIAKIFPWSERKWFHNGLQPPEQIS